MSEFQPTENAIPAHARVDRRTDAEKVFGIGHRVHPVTQMPLEQGLHALSDDQQALRSHVPSIRETQGAAAAEAMQAKVESFIAAKKAAAKSGGGA